MEILKLVKESFVFTMFVMWLKISIRKKLVNGPKSNTKNSIASKPFFCFYIMYYNAKKSNFKNMSYSIDFSSYSKKDIE